MIHDDDDGCWSSFRLELRRVRRGLLMGWAPRTHPLENCIRLAEELKFPLS